MKRLSTIIAILAFAAGCGSGSPETSTPLNPEPTATPVAAEPAEAPAPKPAATRHLAPAAPDFTLPDLDGAKVSLSQFRGKTVVLEWFNPGCPFVKYAYNEGPLKSMAKTAADKGVVWLSINSGAPGKQGAGLEKNKAARAKWAMASKILVDKDGKVGKSYAAKTTPHMFVIDAGGGIVYKGALDNAALGKAPKGGEVNYVEAALNDLAQGRAVKIAETKSYGCSVKYVN